MAKLPKELPLIAPQQTIDATCVSIEQSGIERLQHHLGNEAITGFVQMNPIVCQNAAGLVLEIVLFQVLNKGFAQVAERNFHLPGNFAADIRIFVKLGVEAVGPFFFLADDTGCAKDHA